MNECRRGPPLLSCSNLFCLLNSFNPSGCSDASGCAGSPPPPGGLTCFLLYLCSPLRPTCWAGPLCYAPHSSKEAEEACRNHGNYNTAGRKKVLVFNLEICWPTFSICTSRIKVTWKTPLDIKGSFCQKQQHFWSFTFYLWGECEIMCLFCVERPFKTTPSFHKWLILMTDFTV